MMLAVTKMSSLISLALVVSFLLMLGAPSALGQSQLASDFAINVTGVDDIVFTGLRNLPESPPGLTVITFVTLPTFPVLAGQGISGAKLKFGPYSINSLHSHPRASELFFVLEGTLVAGLVDSTGRLLTKTLYPGDTILFPIGLTHYQFNPANTTVTCIAAFSNPNGGRISLPPAMFNSKPPIDVGFLTQALQLDAATIERLQSTVFPAVG